MREYFLNYPAKILNNLELFIIRFNRRGVKVKKNILSLLLIIAALFLLYSCANRSNNELNVIVSLKDKSPSDVRVYVREVFPLEDKEVGYGKQTNDEGFVHFDELADDMYEVWIVYPGYEEVRQRLPLRNNSKVTIKTTLPLKSIPEKINSISAYGSFNSWDIANPAKLTKDKNEIWKVTVDSAKTDSTFYYIYFDKPYQQYYNPFSGRLIYLPGHQPPYQSVAYNNDGKFKISFDESKFQKSSQPFLNHWVDREISGIEGDKYILLEKLLTENFQVLSRALYIISNFSRGEGLTLDDKKTIQSQLKDIYESADVKKMLTQLYDFSENNDDEVVDLAKIELAKIYWLLGLRGKSRKSAEKVDLESFAGGEAYRIATSELMKIPGGFSEYTRKKLEVVKNPKARFVLLEKLALAYQAQDKKDKVKETYEMIVEEFPDTEMAKSAKRLLDKLEVKSEEKEED